MFCPNCGTQNADNAAFCAGCGAKLSVEQPVYEPQQPAVEPQQPVSEPQQPVYQQPVYQQPAYQQPAYQQPVYQQPFQQPVYQQPVTVPGKGLGIAGMVLGIIALLFTCCSEYISIPCAVIGLILSIVGLSKAKKAGMKNGCALAGIICTCIALVITTLLLVLAYTVLADLINEINGELGAEIYNIY